CGCVGLAEREELGGAAGAGAQLHHAGDVGDARADGGGRDLGRLDDERADAGAGAEQRELGAGAVVLRDEAVAVAFPVVGLEAAQRVPADLGDGDECRDAAAFRAHQVKQRAFGQPVLAGLVAAGSGLFRFRWWWYEGQLGAAPLHVVAAGGSDYNQAGGQREGRTRSHLDSMTGPTPGRGGAAMLCWVPQPSSASSCTQLL